MAYDSHVYVMEDTPISAKIQASDIDLDVLTLNLASLPQHGVLTLSDQQFGHFMYTPMIIMKAWIHFHLHCLTMD